MEHIEANRNWLTSNVSKHSYVAIRMEPDGESIAALLSTEICRMPAVLVPAALPASETHRLVETVRPAALFTREKSGPSIRSRWTTCAETLPSPVATESTDNFDGKAEGLVCQLTSGSFGPSRLAVRSVEGVAIETATVAETLNLTESDRVMCASSVAHSYGLIGGVLAPLLQGSHVVVAGDPADVELLGQRIRPTIFFGLSSTYSRLLTKQLNERILSDSRFILSAGAPLPKGLFSEFLRRFGKPIRQDYGTTETGTISIDCEDDAVPESVGKPLSHMELKISQPQNGQAMEAEEGEICVRSAAIASHVLDERSPVRCTDEDGWYHTGDIGRRARNGLLRVGRRLRQPVVLDGLVVQLDLLEEAIQRAPGVREVAALPIHTDSGVQIKAVVAASGTDLRTVKKWVRERLPDSHRFLSIELIDELPRSPAGKVLQKYLV